MPFTDSYGQPRDQRNHDERAQRRYAAVPAHPDRAGLFVSTAKVIDDHVGRKTRDGHQAVEDQERGGAEPEEWSKAQRDEQALEELEDMLLGTGPQVC